MHSIMHKLDNLFVYFIPALINGSIDFVVILSLHTMYTSHVSGAYVKTVNDTPGLFALLNHNNPAG